MKAKIPRCESLSGDCKERSFVRPPLRTKCFPTTTTTRPLPPKQDRRGRGASGRLLLAFVFCVSFFFFFSLFWVFGFGFRILTDKLPARYLNRTHARRRARCNQPRASDVSFGRCSSSCCSSPTGSRTNNRATQSAVSSHLASVSLLLASASLG